MRQIPHFQASKLRFAARHAVHFKRPRLYHLRKQRASFAHDSFAHDSEEGLREEEVVKYADADARGQLRARLYVQTSRFVPLGEVTPVKR